LVEPNDPQGLVNSIMRLYEDKALRFRLENNARKSVLEYDWVRIHAKIDDALNNVKEKAKNGE